MDGAVPDLSTLGALDLHEKFVKSLGSENAIRVSSDVERQIMPRPILSSHRLLTVAQNRDIFPIIRLHEHKDEVSGECVWNCDMNWNRSAIAHAVGKGSGTSGTKIDVGHILAQNVE